MFSMFADYLVDIMCKFESLMVLQVMDNLLMVVSGVKRVVLYSPKDALYLYLKGNNHLPRLSVLLHSYKYIFQNNK